MWFTMLPVVAFAAVVYGIPCEEARMKCMYRVGCGKALQNYMVGCSLVLQESAIDYCPKVCEYSLIALVSTEEGKALMECECSDPYCQHEKERTEICKPSVIKTINEPVVACRIAQRICNANAACATAFDYYQRNCKAMFHGKKCTPKCHNSISILRRQEKAQQLKMCTCDGKEDYDCPKIQRNMEKLCFHKAHHRYNATTPTVNVHSEQTPEVIRTSSSECLRVSLIVLFVSLLLLRTR
ncbi:hypothetical protein HUJ04_004714 [Dendroctonus ponderosae]